MVQDLLNTNQIINNQTVVSKLKDLHPPFKMINNEFVLKHDHDGVIEHHEMQFAGVTTNDIIRDATSTTGSAGPSVADVDE
ncbi:hypothetical protein GJ496_009061 [Pomphorhynchus laevis]|nr:hypothetical protein GJ496_009061 [Pomphorhynchus laevis]